MDNINGWKSVRELQKQFEKHSPSSNSTQNFYRRKVTKNYDKPLSSSIVDLTRTSTLTERCRHNESINSRIFPNSINVNIQLSLSQNDENYKEATKESSISVKDKIDKFNYLIGSKTLPTMKVTKRNNWEESVEKFTNKRSTQTGNKELTERQMQSIYNDNKIKIDNKINNCNKNNVPDQKLGDNTNTQEKNSSTNNVFAASNDENKSYKLDRLLEAENKFEKNTEIKTKTSEEFKSLHLSTSLTKPKPPITPKPAHIACKTRSMYVSRKTEHDVKYRQIQKQERKYDKEFQNVEQNSLLDAKDKALTEKKGVPKKICKLGEQKKKDKEFSTFSKRKGTTNFGQKFENLVVASIVFRFTIDDKIENFDLSANDANYEGFDDIVFGVNFLSEVQQKYAMQLKYGNTARKVTRSNFIGNEDDGDFNLFKHFNSFSNLNKNEGNLKCILCTNRKLDETLLKGFTNENQLIVKFGDHSLKLKMVEYIPEIETLSVLKSINNNTSHYYKFLVLDIKSDSLDTTKVSKYKDFFNNFLLLTDLMFVAQLEKNLEENFSKIISKSQEVFKGFLDFINKWSTRDGNRIIKLEKFFMKKIFALHLVAPHIRVPRIRSSPTQNINEKFKLFAKAILEFKITAFHKSYEKNIVTLLPNFINDLPSIDYIHKNLYQYELISSLVQEINKINGEDFAKIMWLLHKCPLVVNDHEDIRKAIMFCQNADLQFVVLCDNFDFQDISPSDIFRNLSDLEEKVPEVYQKIFENFSLMFQGRNTFLVDFKELFRGEKLSRIVTTDELICMAGDSLHLETKREDLPPSYIERSLSKTIISLEFLKEIDENSEVLLSSFTESSFIGRIKDFEFVHVELLTTRNNKIIAISRKSGTHVRRIFVTDSEHDEFERFCSFFENKTCHLLRLEDSKLEWVRSKNNKELKKLKEYQLKGDYVKESELLKYEIDNNINIICDEPGMGKTTLMESMKNKNSSEMLWTILIYVKNNFLYFQKNEKSDLEEFEEYILRKESERLSYFGKRLLEMFMEKHCIRYIWDGLDELSKENFKVVQNLIDKLSEEKCKQWLTSRTNLKDRLEHRYSTIARTLKKFGKNEQNLYVRNRLKNVAFEDQTDIQMIWKHSFLENPLQMFVLTELLLKDTTKYSVLCKESFTTPDLYKYFIDVKFDMYNRERLNLDENARLAKKIALNKKEVINNYEKIAALTFFEKAVPKELHYEVKDFLEQIRADEDIYGIITKVTKDNKVEFFHSSFGEYFAVSYLVKSFEVIPHIKSLIFKKESIQCLFDGIVSDGCKAHRAVLHKNFDVLRACTDDELKQKDKIGRNALHLACCYSEKYSLLPTERNGDVYVIDDRVVHWQELKPKASENKEMLNFLIEKCNATERDKLGFDCFEYAYKNHCFPLLALMQSRHHRNLENFETHIATILYYSIRLDHAAIFDKIEKIPFIKSKHFGKSLLFLAVYYNSVNSLQKILCNPYADHYRKIIEEGSELLVIEACDKSNDQIIKILLNNGGRLEREREIFKENQSKSKKRVSKKFNTAEEII